MLSTVGILIWNVVKFVLQLWYISMQLVSSILICFKSTINFSTLHLDYTLTGEKNVLSFIITFYVIIIITLHDIFYIISKSNSWQKAFKKSRSQDFWWIHLICLLASKTGLFKDTLLKWSILNVMRTGTAVVPLLCQFLCHEDFRESSLERSQFWKGLQIVCGRECVRCL